MRDDRYQLPADQVKENLIHAGRDATVGELYQEVLQAIDGVAAWVGANVLEILVAQMKVAAQQQYRRGTDDLLQRIALIAIHLRIEMIAVVRVRRRDHVGDAVLTRH